MSFSYEADLRAFSNSILLWHLALAIFTAAVSPACSSDNEVKWTIWDVLQQTWPCF